MIKKIYRAIITDSLYRNSAYLLINSILSAILGFLFWTISTRLFAADAIGLVTTVTSSVELLSLLSIFGLNISLVRYLPTSTRKSEKVSTVLAIVTIVSVCAAVIFVLVSKSAATEVLFEHGSLYILLFCAFVIIWSLSEVMFSVFRAYRSSQFVLIKNVIFHIARILLIMMVFGMGAIGLLSAWMIALVLSVIFSLFILSRRFHLRLRLKVNLEIIKNMARFSFASFVTEILEQLPRLIMPLLITTIRGPEQTAYYFMSMSLAAFIFIIPQSISSSLYAEGSVNEQSLHQETKKVILSFLVTLIPTVVFVALFGNYVLLFYGSEYSEQGAGLLTILAVSSIPLAFNTMFNIVFKIKHYLTALIGVNAVGSLVLLILSYSMLSGSLIGVGWAWLWGQILMCVLYVGVILYKTNGHRTTGVKS